MPRRGKSFYIESQGPNDAALTEGIRWLLSEAAKAGKEGLVAVSYLQNLRNLSWSCLAPVFDQLARRGSAAVQGVQLRLLTLRKGDIYAWDGPILILMGTRKLWDAVDTIDGTADALLVPWNREVAQDWIDTGSAQQLGATSEADASEPDADTQQPKMLWQLALDHLTAHVNLNTGIIQPSDKLHAVRTLETLFYKRELPDSKAVRQYLMRSGWQAGHARDVGKLTSMIGRGRTAE